MVCYQKDSFRSSFSVLTRLVLQAEAEADESDLTPLSGDEEEKVVKKVTRKRKRKSDSEESAPLQTTRRRTTRAGRS